MTYSTGTYYKTVFSLFFLVACTASAIAQSATDAFRWSNWNITGTARTFGAGGAMGALGADFGTISTNPAGLAVFRKSEFTLTPQLQIAQTSSTLLSDADQQVSSEQKNKFGLSNIGAVFANHNPNGKWKTANFAIGFNQLANYNQSVYFEGRSLGSITDRWADLANNNGLDDFEAGPASDVLAIYTLDDNTGLYHSDFELAPDALVLKSQSIENGGSNGEMLMSVAGNYDERIMAGIAIGVPILSYTSTKIYGEEDSNQDEIPFFNNLTYEDRVTTTGNGLNVKLGLILRLNQMIRLGLSAQSPTGFKLNDIYSTSVTYDFTDEQVSGPATSDSPSGNFEYKISTPWRMSGGAGFILGKSGFISADAEYIDYSKMRYDYLDPSFAEDERNINQTITETYKPVLNIRLGAEYAYQILRLRAGYALLPSVFAGDDQTYNSFSLGAGIRGDRFFLDLAARRTKTAENYLPYQTVAGPLQETNNNLTRNQFLLTFGYKF